MKKQGFTLAEMLIALALIGVIAALLIPKLLSNVGNRQDVAKLRAAVSAVERVLNAGMTDPDADRNVTFAAMLQREMQPGTAPAALALDCTAPAAGAGNASFYFPDGSAVFITGTSGNDNMSTGLAEANICIELNTRANTTDGYSGALTTQGAGVNARYFLNWNAAAAAGATQNAAGLLY